MDAGIGVVVDGCPAGLPLDEQTVQQYLNRRKPGQTKYSTPRKEDDLVEIQSGVFEGKINGERRYPWWYTIKHSGLLIIRRLHPTIALGTQTIRLSKIWISRLSRWWPLLRSGDDRTCCRRRCGIGSASGTGS